ncbi:YeeE/YedE family protein [Nonlabens sp. SCSIO 43208]|uniref:YeeE/YedE family protein n=1 Tax=Nonlabens sp. SCSIO 43208 TaxID=2793009 RepID=UPI003D6A42CB
MHWIYEPWPWYVAGPLIALVMFLLLFLGKQFGISANLRTKCAAFGAGKTSDFFDFDWKEERWNLMIVLGAIIGGFLGSTFMTNNGDNSVSISKNTVEELKSEYHFLSAGESYLPEELFAMESLNDFTTIEILLVGGFLVGFGARYAGGCTSGHAISGLSNLQLPSLIAVIGFFIGGLIMIHVFFPLIF